MSINFEELDKTKWVCIQLPDQSVYYGEVAYIDESQKIVEISDNAILAQQQGLKKVRHGLGIQLYGSTNDDVLCKYEGQWDRDRKHGEGICTYPDKSIYQGNMNYDVREGYGRYIHPNGDVYEGNWKTGKMEGGGKFTHHEGIELNGLFKNNYFHCGGENFMSPFMSKEEINEFLHDKKKINELKEQNKNQKLFMLLKTNNWDEIGKFMIKSRENGRIPIILSSKQAQLSKDTLYYELNRILNKKVYEFDLRQASLTKSNNKDQYFKFMELTKKDLSNTLVKGEIFILNIDDSQLTYEEIFDPDVREFYHSQRFPSQIFNINELSRREVYEKVISNTENWIASEISNQFKIAVWSKYKIDETLENKKVIEKFERRFSSILPVPKLDLLLITENVIDKN